MEQGTGFGWEGGVGEARDTRRGRWRVENAQGASSSGVDWPLSSLFITPMLLRREGNERNVRESEQVERGRSPSFPPSSF
jgi:hypothetical protein